MRRARTCLDDAARGAAPPAAANPSVGPRAGPRVVAVAPVAGPRGDCPWRAAAVAPPPRHGPERRARDAGLTHGWAPRRRIACGVGADGPPAGRRRRTRP